jgi:Cys-tRNA(Pro) deacylase
MQTPATAYLKAHGIAFTEHAYEYVEHGGTAVSAESLGVPEREVVKTLVMQDEQAKPLIVLMHGDRKVSTKNLARQAGRKSIEPCRPDVGGRRGLLVKIKTQELVSVLKPQVVEVALED